MDKRTKIFAGVFGVIIAYTVVSSVVYPNWIQPLLTLTDRVAEAQKTLDKLEDQDARVEQAKREYRRLAERVGSMDVGKVKNALDARIKELINKHKLEGASVAPTRPTADKTGIERMVLSINAVGTLEAVVGFMQDVAELPHLIRVGNVNIYPASSSKRNEKTDRVNMRLPIEVVVLPQQKVLGEKLADKDFKQPEKIVRHQERDYSLVWKRTPFTDFVPLPTLTATAGQPQTVPVGQSVMLQGGATGGDGKYSFEWSGDGLSAKDLASVPADTSAIGQKNYTLVVKDGSGNSASARVTITVVEPPPPPPDRVVEIPPPPPPPVKVRNTWPDRSMRQVAMTLQTQGVPGKQGELLVVNQNTRERTYHAVGDDFDGGKLVHVDTRGGIVRWEDKFYIYPLGSKLDQDIPADSATNHPELLRAVERLKLADAAPGPQIGPEAGAATDPSPAAPITDQPVAPDGGGELVPAPSPETAPAEATGQPRPFAPDIMDPGSATPSAALTGHATTPGPSAAVGPPGPASVDEPKNGVPTQGEVMVAPPIVKDGVKERPSRGKSRRSSQAKPVTIPPPEQGTNQESKPEQK